MEPQQAAAENSIGQQQKYDFKKLFLKSLIGSLCASALIAILIFLWGDFGNTQFKILMTTLSVCYASLSGLCSSTLFEKGLKKEYFGKAGILIAVITLLMNIAIIWGDIFEDSTFRTFLSLNIISFAMAHSSLMFIIRSENQAVAYSQKATLFAIAATSLTLVSIIWGDSYTSEFSYRLLGVLAILTTLGTIVTPILKKTMAMPQKQGQN